MEKDVRLLFQIMYIYSKDTNCIKRYWILPNICLVDSKIRTDGWSLRQREERAGSWKLLSDDHVRKHSTCNVELKSHRVLSIDNIPSILRMIIWKTIEFHDKFMRLKTWKNTCVSNSNSSLDHSNFLTYAVAFYGHCKIANTSCLYISSIFH